MLLNASRLTSSPAGLGIALLTMLTLAGCPTSNEQNRSDNPDAATPDAALPDAALPDTGGDPGPERDAGADPDASDPDLDPDRPLDERVVIYQLVVRHFGNTRGTNQTDGTIETNGVGKFADINDAALSQLRDMGMTHIYLTGVLQQATLTDYSDIGEPADDPDLLKGRAGSFFAVRDYFDVSPDYALEPQNRLAEFRDLVERIHAHDMKVLIDLVPNHVARSYGSTIRPELDPGRNDDQSRQFSPQNNFFYLPGGTALTLPTAESHWQVEGMDGRFEPEDGTPGRFVRVTGNNVRSYQPSINDWYETVKLNYGYNFETGQATYDPIPPTWHFIDEVLAYWQEFGVDGFRSDFAHYVPTEAWRFVIDRARARDANVYFTAEAYENLEGLLDAGFDSVYEDRTYDLLKGIYNGTSGKHELDHHFASISPEHRHRYLRYLENHDERRIASPIVPDTDSDHSGFGSPAAGRHVGPVAYLVGPGPVMIYNGQTEGEEGAGVEGFSGDDGRTSIFDYWTVPALAAWAGDGSFDGRGLTHEQRDLQAYYRALLDVAHHPLARSRHYYGLDYHNRDNPEYHGSMYAFARYDRGGDRMMVVVTNWSLGPETSRIRLPADLVDGHGHARLGDQVRVTRILDERGHREPVVTETLSRDELIARGFAVDVPNQASHVFVLE